MFKRILIALAMFLVAGSCFAQSDLVFFDTDGSRAGVLVQFVEDSSCDNGLTERPQVSCNAIIRQNTSLISVNLISGEIDSTNIYYALDNCEGQAHVWEQAVGPRGGMLLSKGDPSTPILFKIGWNPKFSNITVKSFRDVSGDCWFTSGTKLATIPAIVDPTNYGMKIIPLEDHPNSKGVGFKGPLTPVTEKPDAMFCNGFENCPTQ